MIENEGMGSIEAQCTHVRQRWDKNANIVEGVVQLIQLKGQLVAFWQAPALHAVRAAVGTSGEAVGYAAPVVQGDFAARHSALAFYQMLTPLLDHLKNLFNCLDLKEGEGVFMNATSLQLLAIKGADMSCAEQQRRLAQQLVLAGQHAHRGGGGFRGNRGGQHQAFHPAPYHQQG